MERKDKIKSLLTFYKCKLENKYYSDDAERIFLEEKIKHFEKILGGEWIVKVCELVSFLMNLDGQTEIFCEDQLNRDFYPLKFAEVSKIETNSGGYSGYLHEAGEETLVLSYNSLDEIKESQEGE